MSDFKDQLFACAGLPNENIVEFSCGMSFSCVPWLIFPAIVLWRMLNAGGRDQQLQYSCQCIYLFIHFCVKIWSSIPFKNYLGWDVIVIGWTQLQVRAFSLVFDVPERRRRWSPNTRCVIFLRWKFYPHQPVCYQIFLFHLPTEATPQFSYKLKNCIGLHKTESHSTRFLQNCIHHCITFLVVCSVCVRCRLTLQVGVLKGITFPLNFRSCYSSRAFIGSSAR